MSTPAACDGHRITAYVDGVLPAESRAAGRVTPRRVRRPAAIRKRSSAACASGCAALPAPEVPPGLEDRVRRASAPPPGSRRRALAAPGRRDRARSARGAAARATFVAWEVARDHRHCFAKRPPGRPRSGRPTPASWRSGTASAAPSFPWSPRPPAASSWSGGRFCPLLDRKVAHLFYAAEKRHLSLYVVPGPARFASSYADSPPRRKRAPPPHGRGHAGHRGRRRGHGRGVPARAVREPRRRRGRRMVDPSRRPLIRSGFTPVGL